MSKKNNYKICTIMTTGRTGSDYLAGCLDGVKNIMTFSGKFNHQIFFKNNNQKIKKDILIFKFIKKNKKIFRHDKLENIRLNININLFKKKFLSLSNRELDQREFFIKLYEAYHLTLKRKILRTNTIVHHSHDRSYTNKFLEDFPNAKLLVTVRDPRANLKSGLVNWFKFDSKKKNMRHVYTYLRRIRDDLNFALKKKNRKKIIKLEDMGSKTTKKKILKFLGVNYDKKINISTFANIPWGGDKLSNYRNTKGIFNKKIINNEWSKFFSKNEIIMLNFIYSNYANYYKIKPVRFNEKIFLFFRSLFPFNFEKMVLTHKKFFSLKLIENFLFYLKRIIYIQLLILKIDIFHYEKKN